MELEASGLLSSLAFGSTFLPPPAAIGCFNWAFLGMCLSRRNPAWFFQQPQYAAQCLAQVVGKCSLADPWPGRASWKRGL